MSRRRSSRVGVLLSLAATIVAFAFVVPSAASAGQVDWDLRASWLRYVTRWGGRTVAVSPATFSSPTLSLPQVGTGTGTTAQYDGGFRSTIVLHGVDVQIEDISVDYNTGAVVGDGHYTPLLSRSIPFTDWNLFTLTGGTKSTAGALKWWSGATASLTANGATVFNGGSNGSYAAGQEFGTFEAEGDF